MKLILAPRAAVAASVAASCSSWLGGSPAGWREESKKEPEVKKLWPAVGWVGLQEGQEGTLELGMELLAPGGQWNAGGRPERRGPEGR